MYITLNPLNILNQFHGFIFSKLRPKDLLLQLDESSRALRTTEKSFGLLQNNLLLAGLTVAPIILQNVINSTLSNVQGVVAYQSEIIVHASTDSLSNEQLRLLLGRFPAHNVAFNPDRGTFVSTHFIRLGFMIARGPNRFFLHFSCMLT